MVFLKSLAILLLFLSAVQAEGAVIWPKGKKIQKVHVKCIQTAYCDSLQKRFEQLLLGENKKKGLDEKLKFALIDKTISNLRYELKVIKKQLEIFVHIIEKDKVLNISFENNKKVDLDFLNKIISYKSGDYFEESAEEESLVTISNYLKDIGYSNNKVLLKKEKLNGYLNLIFRIELGEVIYVENVFVQGAIDSDKASIEKKLSFFLGKPFNKLDLQVEIDDLEKVFFGKGFFFFNILEEATPSLNGKMDIYIKVFYGVRFNFDFLGNRYLTKQELISLVKNDVLIQERQFNDQDLVDTIEKKYEEFGIYNTKVIIRKDEGVTSQNIAFRNYYVNIVEGHKYKIKKINLNGNLFLSDDDFLEIYEKRGTALSKNGFLDKSYLENFSSILKEEYLKRGFIFAEVDSPIIQFNKDQNCFIEFRVKERDATKIKSIKLSDIDNKLGEEIKSKLINKEENVLNVIVLEEDIKIIVNDLRNRGYIFASIKNLKDEKFLIYSNNFSNVEMNFNISLGKKSFFENLLITGNKKTKYEVIEREFDLEKGEILTPTKIERIKKRLDGLNLFSSVRIKPIVGNLNEENFKTNLLVEVREKDFGAAELAPGFRTDLGMKLSTGIRYNNLDGMNRTISANAQVNYRFNLDALDDRRQKEDEKLIELGLDLNYIEPYFIPNFIGNKYRFDFTTSFRRKRFFGFDANILRLTPKISKVFNKYLSASLKYQFEYIDQFNATVLKDNDNFRIGGITPSVTLDFRDNTIIPRKGALFGLSFEWANPLLGSQQDNDLEVNYFSFISRNSFYLPVSNNVVFAFFYSAGLEKNLANDFKEDGSGDKKGFIPSIKVFRLDGINVVRGFSDDEINLLDEGVDISQKTIDDRAYFSNFKFEARYLMSDTTVLAGFFDAGRVFVDTFRPLDLRSAVGLSFKFITPVGSLDFDYGVKIKRKALPTGGRESFGRFHLNIGFF